MIMCVMCNDNDIINVYENDINIINNINSNNNNESNNVLLY